MSLIGPELPAVVTEFVVPLSTIGFGTSLEVIGIGQNQVLSDKYGEIIAGVSFIGCVIDREVNEGGADYAGINGEGEMRRVRCSASTRRNIGEGSRVVCDCNAWCRSGKRCSYASGISDTGIVRGDLQNGRFTRIQDSIAVTWSS